MCLLFYLVAILSMPGDVRYTKNFTSFHIWRDLAELEITPFTYSDVVSGNMDDIMVVRQGELVTNKT